MFQWVDGLSGQELEEFEQWLGSLDKQSGTAIILEYGKMRSAGLTIDTARYLYEGAYESHLVPFEEARAYLLFIRVITDNQIVSLGHCSMARGINYADNLTYGRACKFLRRTSMRGYPRRDER